MELGKGRATNHLNCCYWKLAWIHRLAIGRTSVRLEVLKKLWEWAKQSQLKPNQFKNKLLLTKDQYGYTAWHRAAAEGNLDALEIVWGWAEEENINSDDLRNKWLLAEGKRGGTVWKMAAI